MIRETARIVFSFLCHQEVGRCWAPGGETLALCQRCLGVYSGAFWALFLLPLIRFRPKTPLIVFHAVFIVQKAVFGFHLLPHPATVRTLSGQLFITGVIFFLFGMIRLKRNEPAREGASARPYCAGLVLSLLLLQALVRVPHIAMAMFLDFTALAGLFSLMALITISVIAAVRR
ncbi:MAG TPA: DUF2085 domain-containing protein [Candidatus Sumerlaeota bacterium]|nr:DUF2085 domain-containing protein [Candidatus Sumerlaeota bacterium]